MTFRNSLAIGAASLALVPAIVSVAHAQETTGAIRGQIVDQSGQPVSGADVTVIYEPTGSVSASTTGASGAFSARGLRVGGPYTVTVSAPGYQTAVAEGISINLGDTSEVDLALTAGAAEDEIIVTGQALDVVQTAIGPSATFDQATLETVPAINRELQDIVRLDPRLYIDEAFARGVQCAGANPRFNSLTVDGVRLNDAFGLNSNGYPTERQPFPFDAIEEVAVELAPFDVQYGGFSGCNINAVTKSGTNEFHGGLFFDYTDDSLQGDTLEGDQIDIAPFEEKRYGFNVGGPIIPNRLFFFVAYEKMDGANTFDRGYEGSNQAVELPGFTEADYNEILRISNEVYNFDPGALPRSFANEDEKLLAKLDWEINQDHRASFVYNYNDGFNISESDGDSNEFEYSNHLYERGAELNSYVGSLFSNWTDNFSTELRLSYLELDNRQNSNAAESGFAEVQIGVGDNTIYLGQDDSRHANKLKYDTLSGTFEGNYLAGDHNLTFGVEREQTDVFNVFVQHVDTQIEFASIADFEAGIFDAIEYANSPTGNPADAAAEFGFAVNTLYWQDEWSVNDALTVTYGARYDWYTSDDLPAKNAEFEESYGFSNAQNLSGEGLLQPRFGFQYDFSDALSFRGGLGLYSGGNPNVWVSNAYSANNVLQYTVNEDLLPTNNLFDYDYVMDDGPGGPGYGVPVPLADAVANQQGSNFEINYIDPAFEIPSEWKAALGATYIYDAPFQGFMGGAYEFNADFLYTRDENPAVIKRGDLEQVGTGVAGVPIFESVRLPSLALTNGDTNPESINIGLSVAKAYDFGLDWTLGYAYSDAEDEQPMTSSVAFSNYDQRAYLNPQDGRAATSNYNIAHRFTALANYEVEWVPGWVSTFSAFFSANEGRPYSFTFADNDLLGFNPFQSAGGSLLYVPTGPDDPNVVFGPDFDQAAFFDFVNEYGLDEYAGGYAERNAFESDWWTKLDLKFEQQIPAFLEGHSASGFIVIDNVTNLINDEWGVFKEASFPRLNNMVDGQLINDGQQIRFDTFNADRIIEPRVSSPSLWSVRVGLKYAF